MNDLQVNAILENARGFINAYEGSVKHHQIIDTYNTLKPLPRGYKATYINRWCAIFVSVVMLKSNILNFCFECSCEKMLEKSKKQLSNEPHKCDLVFYGVKNISHVGIVEDVRFNHDTSNYIITTIEGNYQNTVGRRYIRFLKNDIPFNIKGFITL